MFNMMELWSTKSLSMVKIVCDWCWIHSRIWGTWECKGRGDCALSKRQSRSQSSTAWRTRPCSRHRYMTCDTLVCACSTVSVPRHHHINGWHAVPESSCFHHCCMMFHVIVPFKTKRHYFSVWFYFWMTSDGGNSKVEWSVILCSGLAGFIYCVLFVCLFCFVIVNTNFCELSEMVYFCFEKQFWNTVYAAQLLTHNHSRVLVITCSCLSSWA